MTTSTVGTATQQRRRGTMKQTTSTAVATGTAETTKTTNKGLHNHHHHQQNPCRATVLISLLLFGVFVTQQATLSHFEHDVRNGLYHQPVTITLSSSSSSSNNIHHNHNHIRGLDDNNVNNNDNNDMDNFYYDESITGMDDGRVPKRLITVFGLESSGTTFVFDAIRQHMKLPFQVGDEAYNLIRTTMVQHVSLPTGQYLQSHHDNDAHIRHLQDHEKFQPPIVPYAVPMECRDFVGRPTKIQLPSHHRCYPYASEFIFRKSAASISGSGSNNGTTGTGRDLSSKVNTILERRHPSRYFVNITSHIEWYERQGTEITTILVVRDPAMHFHGVLHNHVTNNETAAFEQYQTGKQIMAHALKFHSTRQKQNDEIRRLRTTTNNNNNSNGKDELTGRSPPSLVVVSYETLMTLNDDYLFHVLDQAGIALDPNTDYQPTYKNGNLKYVKNVPENIHHQLSRPIGPNDISPKFRGGSSYRHSNNSRSRSYKINSNSNSSGNSRTSSEATKSSSTRTTTATSTTNKGSKKSDESNEK